MGSVKSGTNYLNALHTLHDEVVHAYVNEEDWSVLRIHNDGTATKHLMNGQIENGTYSLVTESLLYYVNENGTEAFIYLYATERERLPHAPTPQSDTSRRISAPCSSPNTDLPYSTTAPDTTTPLKTAG